MRALERLIGTRIVALPEAIDSAEWPAGALVLRLAPDEVLVNAAVNADAVPDAHAIVEHETGYSGVWVDRAAAVEFLQRECDWEIPADVTAFTQGLVAGLPVKVWFDRDLILFIVASPFATDLSERLR